jgi:2-C-methyl-D-erythritol 4-phosphate cytidylyltransferase
MSTSPLAARSFDGPPGEVDFGSMTATSSPPLTARDVAVLVPAAGQGLRLGAGKPKALHELAGKPLLWHCWRNLAGAPSVAVIIVAAPPDAVDLVQGLLHEQSTAESGPAVTVVAGGATRRESVAAALVAVPADFDIILVHDAARALAPPDLVEAVASAVRQGKDAVIPSLPVVDTIKEVSGEGQVVATVEREALRAVQTPQGFRREVLVKAHRLAPGEHTDDAGMVERLGVPVHTVAGHPRALKITTPWDLVVAETILRAGG